MRPPKTVQRPPRPAHPATHTPTRPGSPRPPLPSPRPSQTTLRSLPVDRRPGAANPAQWPPAPESPRRSGDAPTRWRAPLNAAQIHSAAYALRRNTVTGNNTCVTAHARQRARRGRTGSASPRSSGLGHNPTRPARHRNADTQSPRQLTGLDADKIDLYRHHRSPTCTTARHPQSRQRLERGVAHPSVPRHTDGAHQQDQTRHDPDHDIGSLNDGNNPRVRYPERRSTAGWSRLNTTYCLIPPGRGCASDL